MRGISEDQLLGAIYRLGRASIEQLLEDFALGRKYRKALEALLRGACRARLLRCQPDGTYTVAAVGDLVEAEYIAHPRGFGFAAVEGTPEPATEGDIFIPPGESGTAVHGDRVLVRITSRRRGRREGRVIQVLVRRTSRLVGTYLAGRTTGLVVPEDERYPFKVVVRREHSCGAKNGEAVVAEILAYKETANPEGRIVEVLGDPDDLQVQTEIVIRKFELPHQFSDQALAEAAGLSDQVTPSADRLDLRSIRHVTIDGENARDFDDAVAVERMENGYRLYVSIADVGHYLPPGTVLDNEAYQRGTSVYFPTRVVPMLPERLSNDLCSLVPGKDRYTFTAILEFDRQGKRTGKRFGKSVILSHHRLTYAKVKRILVEKDRELRREYHEIVEDLAMMAELAAKLENRRMQRGSIGFEIPDATVVVGEDNRVERIERLERNIAHKLIEEFMLAANEAVAETMAAEHLPGLYRIHEPPDPLKVEEFADFAASMGLPLPPGSRSPHWFGKVLALVAGTPKEYIVSNLLLRTMKQARYSAENVGHFGLAAPYYTHFTSPIRRYPDLMVHRVLAQFLVRGRGGKKDVLPARPPAEAAEFLSKRERVAVDAEREMVDRLSVRFMADRIGESFTAVISGITGFGMFVELVDAYVSGAVALRELRDDYYEVDEKHHRLLGRSTGRVYQLGDLVTVRLAEVDIPNRRLNFLLVPEPGPQPSAGRSGRGRRRPAKARKGTA